jgi:hypothetical protein
MYMDSLRTHGMQWLGMKFYFPLIWCPSPRYIFCFSNDQTKEETLWEDDDLKLFYYVMGEPRHHLYALINLHHKYYHSKSSND